MTDDVWIKIVSGLAGLLILIVGAVWKNNSMRMDGQNKKLDEVNKDVTDLKVVTGEHTVKLEQIKEGQNRIEALIRNGGRRDT